jgi:hypothetical protein
VIPSEFLPLDRLGWLVYGGQFELRFGSSRPGTVFRAVASPFVVGNVHLNSGGVFVRFYMRLSAALYLVRVAQ